ncbi:S1 family peptidase [Saccharothrix australiensis]|uniref:Streptogrisin C n=1 Tax=Saccharothrix australiensis TaxID=2072 RepID=A0A495W0A1_9PSEU|nr:S1 family peptidase [Saccharothrix australiensis]RKT55121.1 streptogrisin C [Saccharothrix australiensis]
MSRPRMSPLAALAVMTTVAATTAASPASAAPEPVTAEQPVPAAMRRDLGVADPVARLTAERAALTADRGLRAALGDRLGGSWFDAERGTLVVAVTDSRAAATVRAGGAEPRLVTRGESTLVAVKGRLDAAASAAPASVPGWRIDPAANSVLVKHAPGAEAGARAWVAATGVDTGAVRYAETTERPRPLIDVVGGNRYWTSKYGCSVGFSVRGGFITAGHCGGVGETTTQPGGRFEGSSFPTDDMAFVRTNAGETPIGAVNDYNGGRVAVKGAQEALVGSSICRSGGTTGWHCGTIRSRDATVDYGPEIGKVYEAIETTACAEPGDSGGSAISDGQAQGVTSGGSGDCKGGAATTYFQPVPEILRAYGVTLLTSDGGGPNPPGCGTAATGTVSTGATAVEPKTGYFDAAAGAQKGCLKGPAGADFDLYLQKQSGTSWRTVASATGPDSTEEVTYTGTAGRYRWQVRSYSGSGRYTLETTKP